MLFNFFFATSLLTIFKVTTAAAAAGTAAVAAYFDAKLNLVADLKALARARAAEKLTAQAGMASSESKRPTKANNAYAPS